MVLAGGSSGLPAWASSVLEAWAGGGNRALGCCSYVPRLCLTSSLLSLQAVRTLASPLQWDWWLDGERAPDEMNLPTGVGKDARKPSLAAFAQKAAEKRV